MTLAAGFFCPDGIVLAADTRESFGEDIHAYVGKIETVKQYKNPSSRPNTEAAYAAIVGSGASTIVEYIVPQIRRTFINCAHKELSEFEQALTELMPNLYSNDPLVAYPHTEPFEMQTEFLVVARPDRFSSAAMFLVNSSLVRRVDYGAHVIGCVPMQETANELGILGLTCDQAVLAATYLIYDAKRRYSSVGGPTHIYTLPHARPGSSLPYTERYWDQGSKESIFGELRRFFQRLTVALGDPTTSDEQFSEEMTGVLKDLHRIRQDFRKIDEHHWTNVREQITEQAKINAKGFTEMLDSFKPTEPQKAEE